MPCPAYSAWVPEQFGISRGGKDAEERFIALTGASPTAANARGDAVLEGKEVEIKRVKKTTINQVRPLKYLPLVLYRSAEADQYPKLKEAMESLLAELQNTARDHREEVVAILRRYGLN